MAPKIAIVCCSPYGRIKQLADAELQGVREAGGDALVFQITAEAYTSPKIDLPILNDPAQLERFDGILFGISTQYGTLPAQFERFWDKFQGCFNSTYMGIFTSTASPSEGLESAAIMSVSMLIRHGLIYVPLGYKTVINLLTNLDEVHGGSPWGAGTVSAADNSRQPTPLELDIAIEQGKAFYHVIAKAST